MNDTKHDSNENLKVDKKNGSHHGTFLKYLISGNMAGLSTLAGIRRSAVFLFLIFSISLILSGIFGYYYLSNTIVNLKKYDISSKPLPKLSRARKISHTLVSDRKETGTDWKEAKRLPPYFGAAVEFHEIMHNNKIEISLDNNDRYILAFYKRNKLIGKISVAKTSHKNNSGLTLSVLSIPESIQENGFDTVHVVPVTGDRMYALGHIKLR